MGAYTPLCMCGQRTASLFSFRHDRSPGPAADTLSVFPMEPPQTFPVKLFRGRVFWLSFSSIEPSLRPPACWVMDLPFLCIYQLFPWLPKFLDPRNRPNLHFLAVWQATPLPLLPFLPFNSQRLTVGNSHSFHCNSSAIKPSWVDSAASVACLVTYNTGHATACLQSWSIDFRDCNIPVHQLLGEGGHPLPGRPCYRRKLSPGGFSDTWLAQLYALSPIARGH